MKEENNPPINPKVNEQDNETNVGKDDTNYVIRTIFSFAFLMFIVIFFQNILEKIFSFFRRPTSKNTFRQQYNVDAKTFNKWVEIFCGSVIDVEDYKKRKKLSGPICHQIETILGIPSDASPTMSKSDIVEAADGSYELLRQAIQKYPDYFLISPAVFKSLNYFPPAIAQRILKGYKDGVEPKSSLVTEKMR